MNPELPGDTTMITSSSSPSPTPGETNQKDSDQPLIDNLQIPDDIEVKDRRGTTASKQSEFLLNSDLEQGLEDELRSLDQITE